MTVTRTQTGLDVAIEQTAKLTGELRQASAYLERSRAQGRLESREGGPA